MKQSNLQIRNNGERVKNPKYLVLIALFVAVLLSHLYFWSQVDENITLFQIEIYITYIIIIVILLFTFLFYIHDIVFIPYRTPVSKKAICVSLNILSFMFLLLSGLLFIKNKVWRYYELLEGRILLGLSSYAAWSAIFLFFFIVFAIITAIYLLHQKKYQI